MPLPALGACALAATLTLSASTAPSMPISVTFVPGVVPGVIAVRPTVVTYAAPLAGTVLVIRAFEPPTTPYGPGHLGVDLRIARHAPVLAAAAGRVRFAGQLAGRGVVVLVHTDGISTEYEPVLALVRPGAVVRRGQPIGWSAGTHRGCPGQCLHWGARRGGAYVDPLRLLRKLGAIRLLPWPRGASGAPG